MNVEIAEELSSMDLGDAQLNRRAIKVALDLAVDPSASFPQACGSDAALEGCYRLLNNEGVTPDGLLRPHIERTVERASYCKRVAVIHDTTQFQFSGVTQGRSLGRLRGVKTRGFFAHVSMVVNPSSGQESLGVAGMHTWMRDDAVKGHRNVGKKYLSSDNEGQRWLHQALVTDALLKGSSEVVHVMDREADSYDLMHHLHDHGSHFVIRSSQNRRVATENGPLGIKTVASGLVCAFRRRVHLGTRKGSPGPLATQIYPARASRNAVLKVSAGNVVVARPKHMRSAPLHVSLNLVCVEEQGCPQGVEPVRWRLLTTLPVRTQEEIAAVVDLYRQRWLIEEFFKALKTGCKYETRQLENRRSILNALPLFVCIAWQLLRIRSLANGPTSYACALQCMTSDQLAFLRRTLPASIGRCSPTSV